MCRRFHHYQSDYKGKRYFMSGTLFVVATPIGNLEDLTPRARQTLAEVDLIAAEDTRHTGRLLSHFGIKTPQFALHDHNEEQVVDVLLAKLAAGKSIALVSDAGTPLISDPGYRIVTAAHAQAIRVSPIAGVSAVTAAMSVAGLPTDKFVFEGFLPARQKARREILAGLACEPRTLIFYESVHRIGATLADLVAAFGAERAAFLGRELTKMHEQCTRASLGKLLAGVLDGTIPCKGEFVIIVGGSQEVATSSVDIDRLLAGLAGVLPAKDVARIIAQATGEKRNALYQRLLELGKAKDQA
jgi:16S rRNA (cytidine1402-2'-O)-methyltransferase